MIGRAASAGPGSSARSPIIWRGEPRGRAARRRDAMRRGARTLSHFAATLSARRRGCAMRASISPPMRDVRGPDAARSAPRGWSSARIRRRSNRFCTLLFESEARGRTRHERNIRLERRARSDAIRKQARRSVARCRTTAQRLAASDARRRPRRLRSSTPTPAAESFFGMSRSILRQQTLGRSAAVRLAAAVARRTGDASDAPPINEYRVDLGIAETRHRKAGRYFRHASVGTRRRRRHHAAGAHDRRKMDRQLTHRGAARSVSGHGRHAGARDQESSVRHPRRRAIAGDRVSDEIAP